MNIYLLFEYIMSFFEVGLGIFACKNFCEKNKKGERIFFIAICVVGGTILCANKKYILFSNTMWLVEIGLIALSQSIFYKMHWMKAAAFLLVFYSVLFVLDFSGVVLWSLFERNGELGMDLLNQYSWRRIAFLSIMRGTDIILVLLLRKYKGRLQTEFRENKWVLFIIGMVMFYCMMQIQNLQLQPIDFNYTITYIGYWILFFLMIGMYLIWIRYRKAKKAVEEGKRQQENLLRIYENAKEENRRRSEQWHDQKHYMGMLQLYLQQGDVAKANQYLDEIMGTSSGVEKHVITGDADLDNILNWKINEAKNKNIRVEIDAMACTCKGEEQDFCLIFGNVLDNAIEACLRLEDPEKRRISIGLRSKKDVLIVKVRNSYDGMIKQKQGKYLSGKREYKEYGFGMECVRELVEKKYHGKVSTEYTDTEFITEMVIILP